ncbi:transposase [Sporosarcina sp. Te-1]|uniref:transposase n=1 Tax=Sporosarcina sp. Te-1 TaxID=2818390 RepID=UPI001A9E821F|nr:transposase [Sporosarcina sp. Te-1]QTD42635.1 transposase [Sporosarcina sp. Te-1]
MKQKRYNQEFKQTIVELYRSGTSVSDLSREYGVSEVTIYKWIKAHSPIENGGGLTPAERFMISNPLKNRFFFSF